MTANYSGRQTIKFDRYPEIISTYSEVGTKEGKGPLGNQFDEVLADDKLGQKTWEDAESQLLKKTILGAIKKSGIDRNRINVIFSGDLINQLMASNYAVRELGIPFMGVYGACSTMTESMILSSVFINGGFAEYTVSAASSHFCTAERQFRLPIAHGNQKPPSAQHTVTGAGSMIFSGSALKNNESHHVCTSCATIGKITDKGINDSNMMGAAMAPAAIDTLIAHFRETGREPEYYDRILSGDLGRIGKDIVLDRMLLSGFDISSNYDDCGCMIFSESQDTHAGGSGCGCSASVFSGPVFARLKSGEWKNVLLMSTGALLSTISTQQGESIPGIAHAVSLTSF